MKTKTHTAMTLALTALTLALTLAPDPASAQNYAPNYAPNHAAEASRQRQLLEQNRLDIQRLQEEQRRTARVAADACFDAYPSVKAPERYPSPIRVAPTAPSTQGQAHINRYIQRVMADPTLTHAAKMRIVRPLLGE